MFRKSIQLLIFKINIFIRLFFTARHLQTHIDSVNQLSNSACERQKTVAF